MLMGREISAEAMTEELTISWATRRPRAGDSDTNDL